MVYIVSERTVAFYRFYTVFRLHQLCLNMSSDINPFAEADRQNKFRQNKKRKRKFIANVKGFGKRENFGRGTHLESDEWNYYISIMDEIKKGFDSISDKREYTILIVDRIANITIIVFSLQNRWLRMCWNRPLARSYIYRPIKSPAP